MPILLGMLLFYRHLRIQDTELSSVPSSAEESESESDVEENDVELKQLVDDKHSHNS